jgi:serine phosphatase RsbU (regulator of sigma subunit)
MKSGMRFQKIVFLSLIIWCIPPEKTNAQDNRYTDSLEALIAAPATPDTLRAMTLCRLSMDLRNTQPSRAIEMIKAATSLSQKIKFMHGEALSLINAGNIYYDMGKRKQALEYWFQSIAVYKKMSVSENAYVRSVGLHGITDNLIFISRLYCEIGELGDFEKHVDEAKEIMKDNPTEYSRLGWIGIDWAGCYFMNGKYDKARSLYYDALSSFSKVNDEYGIANTLANLGMLQNKMEHADSALYFLHRSLKLYKKVNSLDGQSWVNNIIGNVYLKRNSVDSAFYFFNEAYTNGLNAKNVSTQISSLINIGNLLHDGRHELDAYRYWRRAYELAIKYPSPEFIMQTTKYLGDYSERQGDFKSALNYFKSYLAVKDSMNTDENMKTIGKLESQYDFDKEQALQAARYEEKLSTERAIGIAEKKQQRLIIIVFTSGLLLVLVFSVFLYNRFRVTRRQSRLIAQQKEIVVAKNKEILDSINYAKRIQAAVLPASAVVAKFLPDSFIIYKPKDIVAGDFYWLESKNDKILVAACDCTGHGVPGAMVSVICNNGLNRSVREHNLTDPGKILDRTREIVLSEFEKSDERVYDGMDAALISYSYGPDNSVELEFSGANNPLWIVRSESGEWEEIQGDKQPIGRYFDDFRPYQKHHRTLKRGDLVYLFTDGYKDQFGGDAYGENPDGTGKKFKSARLKKIILTNLNKKMNDQKVILEQEFENWRGDYEQVDDVCGIGIRL